MTASLSESARRPVRLPMVWITPALASQESQRLREADLQTNPESSPIIAPVYKARCPPFVGQRHSSCAGREPGTPQNLKMSESALVLRKTLGVVRCALLEPPSISRPNSLTIRVRKGFRDGTCGRISYLSGISTHQ
jgi:hypothetical protein